LRRDHVDGLEALLGDGEIADRNVGQSVRDVGQQPVPGCGKEVDRERTLSQLLRVLLIEVPLEVADELGGEPALAALSLK
jgi:hypothetical protein